MSGITVIGGKSSDILAKKLAKNLKASFVSSEVKIFPDGESKITISAKPKGRVIVVNSTYPPVDSNLIQILSLISKAKQSAREVVCVIPYMGYARQDREFLPGEIVTLSVIAKLLSSAGASKIIVVDMHSMLGAELFKIPIKNVSAVPELANYLKKLKLKEPIVISPDLGGKERAAEFAKFYGTDYIALKKQRDRKTGRVQIMTAHLDSVNGLSFLLFSSLLLPFFLLFPSPPFLPPPPFFPLF
ncbi:MAG: ribose-phosphate diphosphokinase, partial [Candidatus Nitrosotenuis sp.]